MLEEFAADICNTSAAILMRAARVVELKKGSYKSKYKTMYGCFVLKGSWLFCSESLAVSSSWLDAPPAREAPAAPTFVLKGSWLFCSERFVVVLF